jgi:translation initiation factor 5A
MKVGSFIVIEGQAYRVVSTDTSRPGKHGHAKVRLVATSLTTGKKKELVVPGHDSVEVPIIEKKTAQVLSITNNQANVMDDETYETFDIEIPEDLKEKVAEGVKVVYWVILGDKVMKQAKSGE